MNVELFKKIPWAYSIIIIETVNIRTFFSGVLFHLHWHMLLANRNYENIISILISKIEFAIVNSNLVEMRNEMIDVGKLCLFYLFALQHWEESWGLCVYFRDAGPSRNGHNFFGRMRKSNRWSTFIWIFLSSRSR